MGYFSKYHAAEDYDREEPTKEALKEQMARIIVEAFPEKNKYDLMLMAERNLTGLYGKATQVLKQKRNSIVDTEEVEETNDFAIPDEEEYRGRR